MHHEGSSMLSRLCEGANVTLEDMKEAFIRVVARSRNIIQLASCRHVDDTAGSSSGRTASRPAIARPSTYFFEHQLCSLVASIIYSNMFGHSLHGQSSANARGSGWPTVAREAFSALMACATALYLHYAGTSMT